MRALIQRVDKASVEIDNKIYSEIDTGLLVLLGIEENDNHDDIDWLISKIINLRIFPDEKGVMNISLLDIQGDLMVVSQFTLHASTKKGNRPSYSRAARPEIAIPIYDHFIKKTEEMISKKVKTGVFGAMMNIGLVNSGPVTILIDTKNKE